MTREPRRQGGVAGTENVIAATQKDLHPIWEALCFFPPGHAFPFDIVCFHIDQSHGQQPAVEPSFENAESFTVSEFHHADVLFPRKQG